MRTLLEIAFLFVSFAAILGATLAIIAVLYFASWTAYP